MLTERLQREEELGIASKWGWVVLRGVVAILFWLLASHPGAITLGLVLMFGPTRSSAAWPPSSAPRGASGRARPGALSWPKGSGDRGRCDRGALAGVRRAGLRVGHRGLGPMTGALEITTAVRLRKVIDHEWTLGLAGGISIAFGLLMLLRPAVVGLAVVFWLGGYAFVIGVLLVVLGFKLKGIHSRLHTGGDLPSVAEPLPARRSGVAGSRGPGRSPGWGRVP